MSGTAMIDIHEDVQAALSAGGAVVALESTIITHGMPWPRNLQTARAVEAVVRDAGAVPATIAVLNGTLHVGLGDGALEQLAQAKDVAKLSRADLAECVARGDTGATTVAATMIAARLAGIDVFATGGIGGVHRGAETSLDISADLDELARTETIVVCAGAKAILDLPKTLEVLESKGVPVIGYRTEALPAFWSRDSGLAAPLRADSAEAIAAHFRQRRTMGLGGGMLIANPVPEADAIARDTIEGWVETALSRAEDKRISGKDVTPFLLKTIFEESGGASLETNIALVKNNARLAAEIALLLAQA